MSFESFALLGVILIILYSFWSDKIQKEQHGCALIPIRSNLLFIVPWGCAIFFLCLIVLISPSTGTGVVRESVDSIHIVGNNYFVSCGDKEYKFDISDAIYTEEDEEPYVSYATGVKLLFLESKVDEVFTALHIPDDLRTEIKEKSLEIYHK